MICLSGSWVPLFASWTQIRHLYHCTGPFSFTSCFLQSWECIQPVVLIRGLLFWVLKRLWWAKHVGDTKEVHRAKLNLRFSLSLPLQLGWTQTMRWLGHMVLLKVLRRAVKEDWVLTHLFIWRKTPVFARHCATSGFIRQSNRHKGPGLRLFRVEWGRRRSKQII
jgi:hypothetical protein